MSRISFFLAQIDVKDSLVADMQKTGVARSGLTLLFGAFGVVTLLILSWAIFIRKRPDDSSRRYSYPPRDSSSDKDNLSESVAESKRPKRRRRKRRNRNPTLAETGGLPPIRTEGYFEDPP